jgi:hypothetical protein
MLEGSCFCGKIHYQIDGKPRYMYQCFCGRCRAASGASYVTNIIVNANIFQITAGKEYLAGFESSPQKLRYYCSCCGSPIYSQGEKTKQVVAVRCGTLKQDPGVRVAYHAFVGSKAPWVEIHDDRPQFQEWPDRQLVESLLRQSPQHGA